MGEFKTVLRCKVMFTFQIKQLSVRAGCCNPLSDSSVHWSTSKTCESIKSSLGRLLVNKSDEETGNKKGIMLSPVSIFPIIKSHHSGCQLVTHSFYWIRMKPWSITITEYNMCPKVHSFSMLIYYILRCLPPNVEKEGDYTTISLL